MKRIFIMVVFFVRLKKTQKSDHELARYYKAKEQNTSALLQETDVSELKSLKAENISLKQENEQLQEETISTINASRTRFKKTIFCKIDWTTSKRSRRQKSISAPMPMGVHIPMHFDRASGICSE